MMGDMWVDKSGSTGYINVDTEPQCIDYLKKRAREFFLDNPDETNYSVALINFEDRTHSIIEFDIETKIEISEY